MSTARRILENVTSEDRSWELDKIRQRQKDAIRSFGYLTMAQLSKFLEAAQANPALIDEYFRRSKGWSNDREYSAVSRQLASWIISSISVLRTD